MSMGATLSVLGLYNNDSTVFDLMQFPSDFTDTQKETVIGNILAETAELEILYPNPVVMKTMIGLWSRKELPYWDRVYHASLLEYNPIENYRRTETETVEDGRTEEHSGSDTTRHSGSNSLAKTGSIIEAETGTETLERTGTESNTGSSTVGTEEGGNDRIDNNITGFDSNTLVPHDETETYYGKTVDTDSEASTILELDTTDTQTFGKTTTNTLNTTDTETFGKSESFQHGEKIEHSGNSDRSMLAFGNIGVTTSQEMLTQEMEIAKIINVIPVIIESFKERFCLMVY